ncbi:MAG: hypothetical protein JNL36_04645, partial [Candidatus Kapabacteria bacterium]|nr:hypothetical protein [Candidatus Kapabacteria bacterium]
MKTIQYFSIIVLLLVVTSCNDLSNQPDPIKPKDSVLYKCPTCPEGVPFDNENDCPLPYDTAFSPVGNQILPKFIHDARGTSVNGDFIIVELTTILNIKTLQIIKVDPFGIIPKEYNVEGVQIMYFSPKENSKVLLSCGGYVKNEKGKTVWGHSIFIYDIFTKDFTDITPSKFGKFGVNSRDGGVEQWTYDEATKTDRLHYSDTLGEYIVQEDRFINTTKEQVQSISISPNNKYTIRKFRDYNLNIDYYTINGIRVKNLEVNSHTFSMAWSPDSRYLAIQGFTYTYIFDLQESDP